MDKYRVTLTPEERADLEHLVSVGKAAARKLTHARILLLADTAAEEEHSDDEIVAALGVGLCTIGRVRKRLVTEGLAWALNPRPQPARPGKIKIRGMSNESWSSWRAAMRPRALPLDLAPAGRRARRPRPGRVDQHQQRKHQGRAEELHTTRGRGLGIEGPRSRLGDQGRVGPFVRRVDPRGPWHRPRFVHGPGVLIGPGRGVLLTIRRAGGLGIPGPASEDCDDPATVTPPRSFLGLITWIMLQRVQL